LDFLEGLENVGVSYVLSFGIFYSHLVYFVAIWYFLGHLVYMHSAILVCFTKNVPKRKIWQPCSRVTVCCALPVQVLDGLLLVEVVQRRQVSLLAAAQLPLRPPGTAHGGDGHRELSDGDHLLLGPGTPVLVRLVGFTPAQASMLFLENKKRKNETPVNFLVHKCRKLGTPTDSNIYLELFELETAMYSVPTCFHTVSY
jgi:hypothetical protein